MTNDPTYDEQLELLKQQDFSKPSSDLPLPGNVKATDRFQRAAYYSAMLPEPKKKLIPTKLKISVANATRATTAARLPFQPAVARACR